MTKEELIELACQTFGGVIKKEERDNFIAFAKLIAEKAIKEALAQEQEPGDTAGRWSGKTKNIGSLGMPVNVLVTPPKHTWVGLSREDCYQVRERESDAFMYGVAWAEAKLKEKNT